MSSLSGVAGLLLSFVGMLERLTNEEVEFRLRHLVSRERQITVDILDTILEANYRKIFAERSYSSPLKWLIGEYGYSQTAAQRRLTAASFLELFPETREAILTGFLHMTNIVLMNSTFSKQEKVSGERVSIELKRKTIEAIYSKTCEEAKVILAEMFPDVEPANESLQQVNSKQTKLTVILDESEMTSLRRAKELLSHTCSNWSETVGALADDYVKRRDPLRRKPAPFETSEPKMTQQFTATEQQLITIGHRYIPTETRVFVLQRDSAKCVYTDRTTGRACGATERIQVDHIIPLAAGGSNEPENLRCLCRTHNLLEAKRRLGRIMDKYWKPRDTQTDDIERT